MSLKAFIQQQNRILSLFSRNGTPDLFPEDITALTGLQKQELAERLGGALSPENLTCDGELRGRQLQQKARFLNAAKKELEALGVRVGY